MQQTEMYLKITSQVTKWQLAQAALDCKPLVLHYGDSLEVTRELKMPDTGTITIAAPMVGSEDGSGESFNIVGWTQISPLKRRVEVKVYTRTDRVTGNIRFDW